MPERSLAQLLQEHRGTHARLERLLSALGQRSPSPQVRAALDEFVQALPGHIEAEDEGLFPRLQAAFPERAELIQRMVDQHREILSTAQGLAGDAHASAPGFDDRARAWAELVREHMAIEDEELFLGAEQV